MTFPRILTGIAIATYIAAALVYGAHGLDTNPQYDNQGIFYAKDLIESSFKGTLGSFLLTERKYPILHVLRFALADLGVLYATNVVTEHMLHVIGRIIAMIFAAGTFLTLWRIGRKLGAGTDAALLLMTGLLFLLFTSAIRPHIPVTFWTLLTLLASIRLREHRTLLRTFLAFACAGCAFATLQNGLLAFLFPAWALLQHPLPVRRGLMIAGWLAGSIAAAAIIGYPFLLAPFFGAGATISPDLGHDVGLHFSPLIPFHWGPQLFGGEIIQLYVAGIGLWTMRARRAFPVPWMGAVCAYIALYLAVFGFHTSAAGRFFLPLLPLLALAGAQTFARMKTPWRAAILLVIIAMSAKLIWLSFQPNTYQQIVAFATTRPGKVGTVTQPGYFFDLAPAQRVVAGDTIESIPTLVIPDYRPDQQAQMTDRTACFHAVASRTTDEIVLLWNDTPLALWHLFEATALGPNMTAYCNPDA